MDEGAIVINGLLIGICWSLARTFNDMSYVIRRAIMCTIVMCMSVLLIYNDSVMTLSEAMAYVTTGVVCGFLSTTTLCIYVGDFV